MNKLSKVGKYRLIRSLGRGGMGDVWLAEHEGPDRFVRKVALKLVAHGTREDSSLHRRLSREARLVSRLTHPNIVALYDFDKDLESEIFYLAMEYIDGMDGKELLSQLRLRGTRGLPLSFVYYVAGECLAALAYAHGLRDDDGNFLEIVHRDVSPSNILLSIDGKVKLTDFGIAKSRNLSAVTTEDVFVGKIPYMSPEQVEDIPLDSRSDLWSLGVVLYEMATGLRLFAGRTPVERMAQILGAEIPSISNHCPDYPHWFAEFMDKLLQRDRDLRFESAAKALEVLMEQGEAISGGQEVVGRLLTSLKRDEEAIPMESLSQSNKVSASQPAAIASFEAYRGGVVSEDKDQDRVEDMESRPSGYLLPHFGGEAGPEDIQDRSSDAAGGEFQAGSMSDPPEAVERVPSSGMSRSQFREEKNFTVRRDGERNASGSEVMVGLESTQLAIPATEQSSAEVTLPRWTTPLSVDSLKKEESSQEIHVGMRLRDMRAPYDGETGLWRLVSYVSSDSVRGTGEHSESTVRFWLREIPRSVFSSSARLEEYVNATSWLREPERVGSTTFLGRHSVQYGDLIPHNSALVQDIEVDGDEPPAGYQVALEPDAFPLNEFLDFAITRRTQEELRLMKEWGTDLGDIHELHLWMTMNIRVEVGVEIARQVLALLDELHSNGDWHGALTPESILVKTVYRAPIPAEVKAVCRRERQSCCLELMPKVKVADWSLRDGFIADIEGSLDRYGLVMSSGKLQGDIGALKPEEIQHAFALAAHPLFLYGSPQTGRGEEPAGPFDDLYFLGVILYEILTGRYPYKKRTSVASLSQLLDSESIPVEADCLNPVIGKALASFVDRALAKDPRERYESARDMRVSLEDIVLAGGAKVSPGERFAGTTHGMEDSSEQRECRGSVPVIHELPGGKCTGDQKSDEDDGSTNERQTHER